MSEETIIENNILVYKDYYCQCPCHRRIPYRESHKKNGIPKYIHGHHQNGIKQSKERIEKRSSKCRGKKRTYEQRENIRISHIGIKDSEETKIRKKKSALISQNKPEQKEKLSKLLKGKPKSEEHCNNISKGLKGKSYEELMGKEKADKLKAKQSIQRKCSPEKRKEMSIRMADAIIEGKVKHDTNYINGHYFSKINNKKFWFRSSYEFVAYELLDENSEIKEWKPEPLRVEYKRDDGSIHNTIPDIIVEYKSGIKQLINIKPDKRTKERLNILKSEASQKYCDDHNLIYSVWTEKELYLDKPKDAITKTLKYLEEHKDIQGG
jgi:hypothetical protein